MNALVHHQATGWRSSIHVESDKREYLRSSTSSRRLPTTRCSRSRPIYGCCPRRAGCRSTSRRSALQRRRRSGSATVWKDTTTTGVDGGLSRQAIYTNLRPGNYRFLVSAMNGQIASESPAIWEFSIAPAFYQTQWFLLFRLHDRRTSRSERVAVARASDEDEFSAILGERTRIAGKSTTRSFRAFTASRSAWTGLVPPSARNRMRPSTSCTSFGNRWSFTSAKPASPYEICARRSSRRRICQPLSRSR